MSTPPERRSMIPGVIVVALMAIGVLAIVYFIVAPLVGLR